MAWGRSTLASSYPAVAMYPILFDYSTSPAGMLPLFFPACKFLQPPVHIQVGFLTRPVTGNCAHDHSGQDEDQDDYNSSFHMISVPCILPSISEIAIAEMNRPVIIQKRSISTSPCSRSSHPSAPGTAGPVRSVWPTGCSLSSCSSQHPYCCGYCYDIVRDDYQLYHTSIYAYGCCDLSCSSSCSMIVLICCRISCISAYTTARCSSVTYSNCSNNSHRLS